MAARPDLGLAAARRPREGGPCGDDAADTGRDEQRIDKRIVLGGARLADRE